MAVSLRRHHETSSCTPLAQNSVEKGGAGLGSVTVDDYPAVNEDEQTFIDAGSRVMVTIRDAAGSVVEQLPDAGIRPVTAIRMVPNSPGCPDGAPGTATPTS